MKRWNWAIVAVALVWAAVILTTSSQLGGTIYNAPVLRTLGGGAAATIIILGGSRMLEKRL